MSQEMLQIQCSACGEMLSIPAQLSEFSCMYCGTRLQKEDYVPSVPLSEGEQGKVYYEAHILGTICNHLGIDKLVTGSEYAGAFEHYRQSNAETFSQLELAINAGVYTHEEAAAYFLDKLEEYWKTDKTRKQRQSLMLETDKFVIAVFLVPMIRSLQLSISERYCETLQKLWCSRHPKQPFYLGTYEALSKGFQKKILGLCFITTAICEFEGKGDDCEELTAFRNFRDGYLLSCPDGKELIETYYDIAPGIVLHIDHSSDRETIYRKLRKEYLQPCFEDIQNGRLQQCKKRYTDMVLTLKQQYLS